MYNRVLRGFPLRDIIPHSMILSLGDIFVFAGKLLRFPAYSLRRMLFVFAVLIFCPFLASGLLIAMAILIAALGIGHILNAVAILANRGLMPVRKAANVRLVTTGRHQEMTPETKCRFLCDIYRIRVTKTKFFHFSVGDLFWYPAKAGVIVIVFIAILKVLSK